MCLIIRRSGYLWGVWTRRWTEDVCYIWWKHSISEWRGMN